MITAAFRETDHQVLIREYHHRIANELQVMMGIVTKSRRAPDRQSSLHILSALEDRIRAFVSVNRLLAHPDGSHPLPEHCAKLCRLLVRAFGRDGIVPRIDVEDLPLGPTEALYVALIVVELTINELKHGLREQTTGTFDIRLRRVAGGAELVVSDDTPATAQLFPVPGMVQALAGRLGGHAIVVRGKGTGVRVQFPVGADRIAGSHFAALGAGVVNRPE